MMRVMGAPRARKMGVSMLSTMCWTMWTLKSSIPYPSMPVAVTIRIVTMPTTHQIVRAMGHRTPRRRSMTTPNR